MFQCFYGETVNGAPGEIRTPDHLVRSQILYPAELRAQNDERFRLISFAASSEYYQYGY